MNPHPDSTSPAAASPHWRGPVAMLTLGTFAVGTDAFVIAGVLPSVASTMQVSVAAAGQLVTVFSLAYALSTPVLGALTAHWPRRTSLVLAMLAFVIGNAWTALAQGFDMVLLSRVVAAAGAGLYTATASATAATLAGPQRRGQAIALVMLGLTSSLVLGAPLGTAISALWNWRFTLWLVTALGAVAGVAVALRVPPLREAAAGGFAARFAPLRDRVVLGALLRTMVVFTGVYIPYTYISAVYAPVTATRPQLLTLILLLFGIAGTAGNLLAGRLADRIGPTRVIAMGSAGLIAIFLAIPWLRGSVPLALLAAVVSGVFAFSLTTPQQHHILAHAPPGTQSFVTALYQAVLYFAVSLSGALGALALQFLDARLLAPLGAAFVAVSLALVIAAARGESPASTQAACTNP
ncbi:MFS transporter [Luteimonas aquatica]|uniref:MFS transporter n=1 Tax=Luteimonas aquatica TaxID=450364 RepID=UPI001F56CDD5|nr:MFS transporter [Luteimonas aquatica]